jgi:hypothetical protein
MSLSVATISVKPRFQTVLKTAAVKRDIFSENRKYHKGTRGNSTGRN